MGLGDTETWNRTLGAVTLSGQWMVCARGWNLPEAARHTARGGQPPRPSHVFLPSAALGVATAPACAECVTDGHASRGASLLSVCGGAPHALPVSGELALGTQVALTACPGTRSLSVTPSTGAWPTPFPSSGHSPRPRAVPSPGRTRALAGVAGPQLPPCSVGTVEAEVTLGPTSQQQRSVWLVTWCSKWGVSQPGA